MIQGTAVRLVERLWTSGDPVQWILEQISFQTEGLGVNLPTCRSWGIEVCDARVKHVVGGGMRARCDERWQCLTQSVDSALTTGGEGERWSSLRRDMRGGVMEDPLHDAGLREVLHVPRGVLEGPPRAARRWKAELAHHQWTGKTPRFGQREILIAPYCVVRGRGEPGRVHEVTHEAVGVLPGPAGPQRPFLQNLS